MTFVTLFDSAYLLRGLALYESLVQLKIDFTLYVIAFDEDCFNKLKSYSLEHMVVISLEEFEDPELLEVKPTRSKGEYCWTCSAKSILYILNTYDVDMCTYIDSDLYFFNDPKTLIGELSEKESVLITEHRYSSYCEHSIVNGKYCVQFMTFKKDTNGMKVLNWWKDRCLEWCYARSEDGKFGDQKYLDDWCERFEGVHELQHIGGGVAPWNVNQYTFSKSEECIMQKELASGNELPLIFYHYHGMELFDKDVVRLAPKGYLLPDTAITYIYKKYIKTLDELCNKYGLWDNRKVYRLEKTFNSDDMDALMHESNFYHYSLFV